jgi:hypothetical protein
MSNQRGKDWISNVTLIKSFNYIIESIRKDETSVSLIKQRMKKKKASKQDAIAHVLNAQNLPRLFKPYRNNIGAKISLLLKHTYNTAPSIMQDRNSMMENFFWIISNLYRDVPNEFEIKYFEYFTGDQQNTLYHKAHEAFETQSQGAMKHKLSRFFDKLEEFLKIKKGKEPEQEFNLEDMSEEEMDNLDMSMLEEYREEPLKREMWEVIWDSLVDEF